jgi:peptidoglycan/LPS O-acetylase OafA/YrhL
MAVMMGHVRGLFFVDFPFIARPPSAILKIMYAVTGFGHQAVIVFFVLSGYFIGTSVSEQIAARRWSWRTYLINRLTRLHLVLIPALLLGALWDQFGMRLPQAASFYFGGLYKYYPPSVALRSTVPVFLGNLFFLQSVTAPVFGSNGPLWSLSYEFWYYILFPAVMLAAASWVDYRGRFVYLALAFLLLWFVGPQIAIYFLIWLLGTLIGRLRPAHWPISSSAVGLASLMASFPFLLALAWVRIHPEISETRGDLMIGICFALWIFALIQGRRADVAPRYAKTSRTLAAFSYTLYLTHFPLLLLFRGLLDPAGNWQPDVQHLLCGVALALAMLSFAYLVAQFTEARTAVVRNRVMQWTAPAVNKDAKKEVAE